MRPSVNRALYTETDIRYQIVPTLSTVHHIIRSQPAPLVLCRPRETGLHGRPEGPQQQPDHHARRVGQEEQQDGLRER